MKKQIILYSILFIGMSNLWIIAQENNYKEPISQFQIVWKKYLHTLKQIQCDVTIENYKGNVLENSNTSHFDCDYPQFVTTNKANTSIRCYNEQYFFSLKRDKSNENWIVEQTDTTSVSSTLDDWNFLPTNVNISNAMNGPNLIASITTIGIRLHPLWLPSLCNDPTFEIQDIISGKEDNGLKTTTIKFNINEGKTIDNMGHNGEVTLLNDHYYLIKNAKFSYIFDSRKKIFGTAEITNEYDFDTSFHVPVIVKQTTIFREGIDIYKKVMIFNNYEPATEKNQKRFTLSHYGLPEPGFGEHRTNRIRYLIIGIGILMMAIGAYRMIQKRRKRF
jgi:hypothetical protein